MTATTDLPVPTAIESQRVLILADNEQRILLEALRLARADAEAQRIDMMPGWISNLADRIAHGDEYASPVDELARMTLRKRRLEAEVTRTNKRISTVEQTVIDDMLEAGESGIKHTATGTTLSLTRKVWAKVCRAGEKPTPDEKAAAAEALKEAGLGDFVKPDFNTNSVSSYFREQIRAYDEDQKQLPEHQRAPRSVESFLPGPLVGLIELTDAPTISVRA